MEALDLEAIVADILEDIVVIVLEGREVVLEGRRKRKGTVYRKSTWLMVIVASLCIVNYLCINE